MGAGELPTGLRRAGAPRPLGPVPRPSGPLAAAAPPRGAHARAPHRARRPGRQGAHDQREPAARRLAGAQVPADQPGARAARPRAGGHARPHPRRREVRLAARQPLLDLRHLVDPPGHRAGHRRQGAPRAPAGQRAAAQPGASRRVGADLASSSTATPPTRRSPSAAGVQRDHVEEAHQAARTVTSLDRPVGEDGDGTLGDLLPSPAPGPDDVVDGLFREAAVAGPYTGSPSATAWSCACATASAARCRAR